MTEDELAEIEARANAATPGPWVDVGYGRIAVGDETGKSVHWWDWDCVEHGAQDQADGTFIAHARTDIPALVAAVRERDAEIAKLKQLVSELTSGKQEVRCPSCGVTIDMGPIVDEVTYVGDTFDLECDKCGCEFTAHAETMTICFDAEVDEVAK